MVELLQEWLLEAQDGGGESERLAAEYFAAKAALAEEEQQVQARTLELSRRLEVATCHAHSRLRTDTCHLDLLRCRRGRSS